MKTKLLVINGFAAIMFAVMPLGVLAQTTPASNSVKPNTAAGKTCEDVQNRIQARIDHWQEIKGRKSDRWSDIKDRVTKIEDKLKANGYDVTKIEEDKKTLETLMDKMNKAFDDVVAKAKEAKATACGDRDVFKANVRDLKDLIKNEAEPAWHAVRNFVQHTLKTDLMSYKNITPTPSATQ